MAPDRGDPREVGGRLAEIEERLRRLERRPFARVASSGNHDALANVSANDHHDEVHAHGPDEGVGRVSHGDLFDVGSDDHHARSHGIAGGEHSGFPGGSALFLREDGTWVAPPGGAGTIDVEDEGAAQGAADTFDFVGAGVSASVAGGVATITIPGGGGSGDEPTVSDWFLS